MKKRTPNNCTRFFKEDALKRGLKWTYWRDVEVRDGDWVITDDDVVVRVSNKWSSVDSDGYPVHIIKTTVGNVNQSRTKEFLGKPAMKGITEIASVSNLSRNNRAELTDDHKRLIKYILNGTSVEDAIDKVVPGLDKQFKRRYIVKMMKSDKVIGYMADQLVSVMNEKGLNEEFLVNELKGLIGESGKDKLEAIKLGLTLHGHLGKKVETKTQRAMLTFEDDDVSLLEGEKHEAKSIEGRLETEEVVSD